jgi:endonuclease/exonuclease/phosphatase family metal-dependent hydrolase
MQRAAMKIFHLSRTAVFVAWMLGCFADVRAENVRVLSFNIRYENTRDGVDGWLNRREAVAKVIAGADLVGLQEVKPQQRAWLREKLPEFQFVGTGREPDDSDESALVGVRRGRFEVVNSQTFWLSETPEVVASKSWDSSLPRVCTWVTLKERTGSALVSLFNVHLDHLGAMARERGIALALERLSAAPGVRILTGDFNAHAGSAPLVRVQKWAKPELVRSVDALGQKEAGTFHGFSGIPDDDAAIDFIFGEKTGVKFVSGAILKTTYPGVDGKQRFVSDHFPISAEVSILEKK